MFLTVCEGGKGRGREEILSQLAFGILNVFLKKKIV